MILLDKIEFQTSGMMSIFGNYWKSKTLIIILIVYPEILHV